MYDHIQNNILVNNTPTTVDEGIAPVVLWLNSFKSVTTLFSCQGYDDKHRKPYVLFYCKRKTDLRKILLGLRFYLKPHIIHVYATVEVDAWDDNQLRYHLKFHSRFHLQHFIDNIHNLNTKNFKPTRPQDASPQDVSPHA